MDGGTVAASEAGTAFLDSLTNPKPSSRTDAIMRRERLKATFGDLTLVHYGVNRSLQNGPISTKRERFFAESNLHLNRALMRRGLE